MKLLLALAAVTLLPAFFSGNGEDPKMDMGKRVVERPLKRALLGPVEPFPGPDRYDLAKSGIEWRKGLDAAVGKGKPVLLFQLLGEFDRVHC